MDENQKPKTLEEHHEETMKANQERDERILKIRKETKKWLESNKEIQEYLKQFNKNSVESFMEQYPHQKGLFMEYGNLHVDYVERESLSYYNSAVECLEMIQLKKLFDLRCQWGANQLKIEEIEITWDFFTWSRDVFNCPFLSPITQEEFGLFMKFADSDDFSIHSDYDWLELFNIRSKDEEDESNMPEWFYYHNIYTGAGQYFALPDIRFEQEEYYASFIYRLNEIEHEKKYASGEMTRYVEDERPRITYHHFADMEKFIKLFEDKKTLKTFYNFEKTSTLWEHNPDTNDSYLDETAQELIFQMVGLGVVLPIEANNDWRIGLINTWAKYEQDETIALLPLAYQDYSFRIDNNIRLEGIELKWDIENSNNVKKRILDGRVLAGEARDFNY